MLKLIQEISQKSNNHLLKKGYLEVIEDIPVVGVTDTLFDATEDLHLPAQAASVAHKIAFGERAGDPVRRLKSQTSLWPSESRYEFNSDGGAQLAVFLLGAIQYTRPQLSKLMKEKDLKNWYAIWHGQPLLTIGFTSSRNQNFVGGTQPSAQNSMERRHSFLAAESLGTR